MSQRAVSAGMVRRPPVALVCAILVVALVIAITAAIAMGVIEVNPRKILVMIADQIGLISDDTIDVTDQAVIWKYRIPRVLLGVAVGASLAASGAAMQGLFGNPLADPGLIGVSSGASLGAIVVIVLGLSTFGRWTLPVGAFLMAILTTAVTYVIAKPGKSGTATLLLVGMALNAIFGAAQGYFTYIADTTELEAITFWSMGSLNNGRWEVVPIVYPLTLVGLLMLFKLAPSLDYLTLGERQAYHMGLDVKRLRRWLIIIVALLVAVAVAFVGTIGFVGLVIPHLVRLAMGPAHKYLIPLAALGGALLVVVADLLARTLDPPAEVPIGILTSTIGGPFFLWMVWKNRDQLGGARA